MNTLLKIRRKALELETRLTHAHERHYRDNARALAGWYRKKHAKGMDKPIPPEPKKIKKEDDRDRFIDENYLKLWNLTDHRKRQLQYEARHLHLVRGFLKDQKYENIEVTGTYHQPDRDYLLELAQEYGDDGDNVTKDKFIKWWDEAYAHILKNEEERTKKREGDGGAKVATA